uniref:protein tyrosine phosphatase domain-containing protein 1-like n=1 Tax=Myxine glutinosa TaxID=7769 RepID=UPI003590145C
MAMVLYIQVGSIELSYWFLRFLLEEKGILCTAPTGMAAGPAPESGSDQHGGYRRALPQYSRMGERLRRTVPGPVQCSVSCRGRLCKYENPERLRPEEQALSGVYSSWVTDGILAMARPSTEVIHKYDIITQFQENNIKSVINLQQRGEHSSCGFPLKPESGFTYLPRTFMDNGIFFYNFCWKDYGVVSLTAILDMVKVLTFALQEGKVAIHCHAGLGRTGVLISCYLVYSARFSADQAVLAVRRRRPNAVQTREQLLCVQKFAQFLWPLQSVFPGVPGLPRDNEDKPRASTQPFNLSQFLKHQQHLLHGYEARKLRFLPKIVHVVCTCLLKVATRTYEPERKSSDPGDMKKPISQHVLCLQGCSDCSLQDLPSGSCTELMSEMERLSSFPKFSRPLCAKFRCRSSSDSQLLDHARNGLMCGDDKPDAGASRTSSPLHLPCVPLHLHKDLSSSLGSQSVSSFFARSSSSFHSPHIYSETDHRMKVAEALSAPPPVEGSMVWCQVAEWQAALNQQDEAWDRLQEERCPIVLSSLMFSWLACLCEPALSWSSLQKAWSPDCPPISKGLHPLEKAVQHTLGCIVDCIAKLGTLPESLELFLVARIICAFTQDFEATGHQELARTLHQVLLSALAQRRSELSQRPERPHKTNYCLSG